MLSVKSQLTRLTWALFMPSWLLSRSSSCRSWGTRPSSSRPSWPCATTAWPCWLVPCLPWDSWHVCQVSMLLFLVYLLRKWWACIYSKTLSGMQVVHTHSFLFGGECEAFHAEHGISHGVFRLFPLMKSLCSLGFSWCLRKGNEMESLSTSFAFWTGLLFFFFFWRSC